MGEHFSLGMGIILISGIFNGAFPLPMKLTRGWKWENTWLAFSIAAVLVLPWILAALFVPHLAEVLPACFASKPGVSCDFRVSLGNRPGNVRNRD